MKELNHYPPWSYVSGSKILVKNGLGPALYRVPMGPYDDPAISSGSSVNHFWVVLSNRGAIERLVSLMTLLLVVDGANAEEHPIKAAMETAESIVLIMVYVAMVRCSNGNG